MIKEFFNWLSVQQYYADFGDSSAKIITGTFDVFMYLMIFFIFLIVAAWIILPVSLFIRHFKRMRMEKIVYQSMYNAILEQTEILKVIKYDIKKISNVVKRITKDDEEDCE